ncbi:MAG: hypothetical protein LBI63_03155, partial [Candidatus Ancillula sp.]|nr:hypothetical protein [Candidatus Ancillula sp.]
MRRTLIRTSIIFAFLSLTVVVYALTPKVHSNSPIQEQTSMWIINTGAGLYGRVNLKDLELDTKQHIQEGNVFSNATVVEDKNNGMLLAGGKAYKIDSAAPDEITDASLAKAENLPSGASNIQQSGDYISLLSIDYQAYIAKSNDLKTAKNINSGDQKIVATSVRNDGVIIAYTQKREIIQYDYTSEKHEVLATNVGPENADYTSDNFEVSLYGKKWALLHTPSKSNDAELYTDKLVAHVQNQPHLAQSSTTDILYIAASLGLYTFNKELVQMHELKNEGVPIRPVVSNQTCNGQPLVYALWQSNTGISSLDCNNQGQLQEELLPNSAPRTGWAVDRGLQLQLVPNSAVLNATKSGEVWVADDEYSSGHFQIVPSTLNNWESELDKNKNDPQKEDPKENVCPTAPSGENAVFGVRPNKDNRIPVLLTALDGNRSDVLSIIGDAKSTNPSMGEFRVVDNGQALALNLPESTGAPKVTQVTVTVTDGGSDKNGACMVPMTYTIQERLYSEPNLAPKRVGNGIPEDHLKAPKYPDVSSVDALTGWVDPNGDDLLLTATSDTGKVVASPNGKLSFQAENVDVGATADVKMQVVDSLGALSRGTLTFTVQDPPPISLDSLTIQGQVGVQQTLELSEFIHGSAGFSALQLSDIPPHISASVNATGTSIKVLADAAGSYRLNYSVEGAKNTGIINFVVADEPQEFSVAPISVFLQSFEDTEVDISTSVQANNSAYFIKLLNLSPKTVQGDPVADIQADIKDTNKLRVAATLLKTSSSDFTDAGSVIMTVESVDNMGKIALTTARIQVYIVNSATSTSPIAVPDQAVAHVAETTTIDALLNDISAQGDVLMLDPRYSTPQEDIETKGLIYVSGNKLQYIAPSTKLQDEVTLDYFLYARGRPETSRVRGIVNIKLLDSASSAPNAPNLSGKTSVGGTVEISLPNTSLDNDGDEVSIKTAKITKGQATVQVTKNGQAINVNSLSSADGTSEDTATGIITGEYALTDETHETTGYFTVFITDTKTYATAFNDYIFASNEQKIPVNPLDNDALPPDVSAKIVHAKLLPPFGSRDDITTREITDEEQLKSFTVIAGETGATTVWQITVDLTSKGTTAGTIRGEKLGTMTEYVIIKLSNEKPLPQYPKVGDVFVKNSEIKHRSVFETNAIDGNITYTGNTNALHCNTIDIQRNTNSITFDASNTCQNASGSVKDKKQTLAFKVMDKTDPDIFTFGIL